MNSAALAGFAFQPDSSAQHFDQAPGNRQPQAQTAVFSGSSSYRLWVNSEKICITLSGAMPMPVSLTIKKRKVVFIDPEPLFGRRQSLWPETGEFNRGFPHQVDQNLTQTGRIAAGPYGRRPADRPPRKLRSSPFCCRPGWLRVFMVCAKLLPGRLKSTGFTRSSLPASIFEKSRMCVNQPEQDLPSSSFAISR